MTRDDVLNLRESDLLQYYDRSIEVLEAYKTRQDHISELEKTATKAKGAVKKARAEAPCRAAVSRQNTEQPSKELSDALFFFTPDQIDMIKELRRIVHSGLAQTHTDALKELKRETEHQEIVDAIKGSIVDKLLQAANVGASLISSGKG